MFETLGVLLGDMKTKIFTALTILATVVMLFFLVTNYIDRKAEREQNNQTMAKKVEQQKVETGIAEGSGKINTEIVQENAEQKKATEESFTQNQKNLDAKIQEIINAPKAKDKVRVPVTRPTDGKKPEKKLMVEEIPIPANRDPQTEAISAARITHLWDTYCLVVKDTKEQCTI